MLSKQENELLTQVGAGTPMGNLLRRYWVPALFSAQLPKADCPPVRVRLMHEDLVAFRDTDGRLGLIDERCPHRTASLFFGRNEECGLRCVYHGWKFDVDGNCVDMPSEPDGTGFAHKIKINAYPCIERGGVVWTYLGPAELKPAFPELEWTQLPDDYRFATRHVQECNWMQALEGGFDATHLAFLHRGAVRGKPLNVPSRYEVISTDFGFVVGTGRTADDGQIEWTANTMLMPFHKVIARQPLGAHVWVPVDDENTMLYTVEYWPDRPLEDDEMESSYNWYQIHTENHPGSDHAIRDKANDYLIDRELQASGQTFSGMKGIGTQDCAIQESMGPVADRTVEHLGVSDTALIKLRRLLIETAENMARGIEPPGLDGNGYHVRSARFTAPADVPFEDALGDRLQNAWQRFAAE